jgi:hypothetical protein
MNEPKKTEGVSFNIREERLKAKKDSEIKPKMIDSIKEQAKKHFEEIFNRF